VPSRLRMSEVACGRASGCERGRRCGRLPTDIARAFAWL
jgi:hypothetical protein